MSKLNSTKANPVLRPGSCCVRGRHKPIGLVHVLLHAPSEIPLTQWGNSRDRMDFCLAAMEHRDGYYSWMRLSYREPKPTIMDWLKATPLASKWVRSSVSFRAPRAWPDAVYAVFGQTPVPEPVDFANIDWGSHESVFDDHNVCVLQAYACGVGMRDLHQMLQTSEEQVHAQLARGVQTLLEYPTFKLWCVPVDWRFMVIPEALGEDPLRQGIMAATLRKDPFLAPSWAAEAVVNTLAFGAYARSDVPRNLLRSRELRTPPFLVAPP